MRLSNLKWVALSMLVLASCSDKDDVEIENPEGPQGNGTMEVMTPEQSKEFLQNTATDFLNLFNPADQKQFVELAAYFDENYGDLEAPDFNFDETRGPNSFLNALSRAAKGDIDALTRAANSFTFKINFDKLAGVYEPGKYQWKKTSDSNDIVFKFSDKNGNPAELTVSQPDKKTSDLDFTFVEWDYDYDSNGNWYEYEEEYQVFLSIPKTVEAKLTANGKQLAYTKCISSIDMKGHSISADVTAELENISATAKISGNDNKVEGRTDIFVNGNKVGYGYATLNGSDLCNKDKWESFEDMDEDDVDRELANMIKNGSCGGDALGKVQVYGQFTYYKEFTKDIDNYYYYGEYSKSEAQKKCQEACDRLNENIKTQLRYDGTVTDQASFQFTPYYDEWNNGKNFEYYVTGGILFPDGTSYDIDSYFEKFTNVTNKWESLLDAYEKIWNQAIGRK